VPVWLDEMKTIGQHASERCTRAAAAAAVTAFRVQPLSLHDITICTKLRKIAAFMNSGFDQPARPTALETIACVIPRAPPRTRPSPLQFFFFSFFFF